jgi:hypothetical protein
MLFDKKLRNITASRPRIVVDKKSGEALGQGRVTAHGLFQVALEFIGTPKKNSSCTAS